MIDRLEKIFNTTRLKIYKYNMNVGNEKKRKNN